MAGRIESRDEIRNWSYGGIVVMLLFIVLLHLQVTRLLPESTKQLYILNEKLLPMSWNLRYMFRALFIFSCAYSSMATSIIFRKPNPYGIYYFSIASVMLLYGYFPNLDWYNAFIFPLTPFVILFNAKHLPKLGFKLRRREDFYNHYQRLPAKGSIEFPLQPKRLKSVVEEEADFTKPLVLRDPDETVIIEAGTGKGKSRGCISHYLESAIKNKWNVVIHEFKGNPHNPDHPELTKFALDAAKRHKVEYDFNVMGFTDAYYTKRFDIYDPYAIKNDQDIRSVNQSLMYSLNKSWAKDSGSTDPFWKDNTISLVNGVTLTAHKYRPSALTMPHLVAMMVRDTEELLDAFINVPDPYIKMYFQAFKNAYNDAKETAGSIISSTQIPLVNLNDSVMFWALSGKEGMNDFVPLNFNNDNPFILSVCNNADLPIHTHGVNTYLKSILARLNTGTNRNTVLLLDEFDQIFLDGIDRSIATVRSAGTKIVIVLQTKKQLEDRFSKAYADKITDLGQNKIYGGGCSPSSAKDFVDGFVPKYQDLEQSLNQGSDDSGGVRTADKKVVETPEIVGQEKFHFSGVLSTGDPATFFNLPFRVNKLDLKTVKLPPMNQQFHKKLLQFREMTKVGPDGGEVPVSEAEAMTSFNRYVNDTLEANRKRIFDEANQFIEDLKHGTLFE